MYRALDRHSRRANSAVAFAAVYRRAWATATATGLRLAGSAKEAGRGTVSVPVRVATRLFGTLRLELSLPVHSDGGEGERVAWDPSLAFPGLRPGESLRSHLLLPRRAALLGREGGVLAEATSGPAVAAPGSEAVARGSPAAEAVVGTVGPPPAQRRQALEAQGVPADGMVGLSGLELAFDERLRGTPGGELLAGRRVLASAQARPAPALRTTVSPALQSAAASALGGQYGGVVAMSPDGGILAVAGIGLDGLQPPGSTFKMVTVTAALEGHVASLHTVFPFATHATLDGVELENANGEECGGSLEEAFAVSCNSVFSPLGVRIGAPRLVGTAEAYGFNAPPGLPGAAESTLPAAAKIQGELAVGSTAIGQGQVLATPLEMATVAATVADGGRRPQPSFLAGARTVFAARASSPQVARTVRHLMVAVVRSGTGTAAAIPGVTVAGKTGTAELKTRCTGQGARTGGREGSAEGSGGEGGEGCRSGEAEPSNTDAWFSAFAPALSPRVVVCVMLVKDGAGGETAAPVARQVIEAALRPGVTG
jgi:cell division protein FtsI/penicillin-binding protein 2